MKNQRNLLSDIARKDYQDYENETEKFRSILDLEDGLVPQTYKRNRLESPALVVKAEEAAIEAKFTEVNAVNKQRLQSLEFTQGLLNQVKNVNSVNLLSREKSHGESRSSWMMRSRGGSSSREKLKLYRLTSMSLKDRSPKTQ
ncbi:hypothetical protein KUCAC02_008189 [Chaenocephalus aceratus]|uniref:Uncharacterized protein n=1 Tax=Chaenocephalus aceratus TaxID=36190 RepID=A0ACB9X9T8_CHAAC|nr:hypothetical protein KUCAC02_008189 [Chaenocephalus aceratus]